MSKVQVHGNQLTLPDDLRRVLTNAENDAIEAEEVEEVFFSNARPPLAEAPAWRIFAQHKPEYVIPDFKDR